jgi:Fe2+ or Zn2+ uptake regulation protein
MTFVELFGHSAQAKLLDFLADHVGSTYSWQEITKHIVQIKQKRKALEKLVDIGFIRKVRTTEDEIRYMINDRDTLVRAVMHGDFKRAKEVAKKEAKK